MVLRDDTGLARLSGDKGYIVDGTSPLGGPRDIFRLGMRQSGKAERVTADDGRHVRADVHFRRLMWAGENWPISKLRQASLTMSPAGKNLVLFPQNT